MTAPTWDELLDRIAAVAFSTPVGRIIWRDIDDEGLFLERIDRIAGGWDGEQLNE